MAALPMDALTSTETNNNEIIDCILSQGLHIQLCRKIWNDANSWRTHLTSDEWKNILMSIRYYFVSIVLSIVSFWNWIHNQNLFSQFLIVVFPFRSFAFFIVFWLLYVLALSIWIWMEIAVQFLQCITHTHSRNGKSNIRLIKHISCIFERYEHNLNNFIIFHFTIKRNAFYST